MAFSDAVKKARKKSGRAPEETKAGQEGNPFAKKDEKPNGEERPSKGAKSQKGGKPAKGGKKGGFAKAVKNAKKRCKGKKC